MKKYAVLVPMLMALSLAACSSADGNGEAVDSEELLTADWQQVIDESAGQEVNMYMWGGSDSINRYLDDWVAPRMKEQYDVTLKRVPMNDAQDIINQLPMIKVIKYWLKEIKILKLAPAAIPGSKCGNTT